MPAGPGEMKKTLGGLEVFAISSGAMISSGLFILPALVYRIGGPAIVLAYLLAAVLVVPAMLSKAELTTAMPKAGGVYFFIHRSLGPLFGTFAGFASWFSLSLKSAFALLGIGIFLAPLFPLSPHSFKLIAIACTLFFAFLNLVSVKESGRFMVILVFVLLGILLLYGVSGLERIDVQRFAPFRPHGWLSLFTVSGMIFISFGGLTKIASVAEEVRNPGRTIPRGMFAAFIVVTLVYVLTVFVTVGLLDGSELAATLTPLSVAAAGYAGRTGFILLAAAAMLAFITTGNAGLLAASRSPLAMSRDSLLPAVLARVNLRFKTPGVSIGITAVFMIAAITFLDLEGLVKVASTMKLILFAFVNISVIFMRESKLVSYKPVYKAPFYPYLQIAGTLVYILLIVEMGTIPLLITLGFFALSLLWYLIYSRSRNRRQSALIRVVERVTAREMRSSELGQELREILIARDEIVEDRFDGIIREAEIIDAEDVKDLDGLFDLLAGVFADKCRLSRKEFRELLERRETESTTAIHAGLAIPHIVVPGYSRFEIVVVRSRQGICFGADIPPVHIVFALAGSQDERNFHLQALMAIAQIVQNQEFVKSWLKAADAEELRNLILLAQRVRKGTL
jgi:APA family basic amino acid/polyamine antiporter